MTGHCLMGQYLVWTEKSTAKFWWCTCRTQTRGHLFKWCPLWKHQKKILRAEVSRETGRGRVRFKVRDLLADERCSRSILDFLSTMDVGRLRKTHRMRRRYGNSGSEGNERRKGGRRLKSLVLEVRDSRCSSPRPPSWRPREWSRVLGRFSFLCLLFVISLVCFYLGQALAKGNGELATSRLRADCGQETDKMCTSP